MALLSQKTHPCTSPFSERRHYSAYTVFRGSTEQKDPTLHFAVLREKALQCICICICLPRAVICAAVTLGIGHSSLLCLIGLLPRLLRMIAQLLRMIANFSVWSPNFSEIFPARLFVRSLERYNSLSDFTRNVNSCTKFWSIHQLILPKHPANSAPTFS